METLPIRNICQVEIRTRDVPLAVSFYRSVFDWRIVPVSADYALIDTGMAPVSAIMKTPSDEWPVGICNYVLVPDCEKAAHFARSLGARLVIGKTVVGDTGWFAGTLDPFGNEIFFWQPAGEFAPRLQGSGKNPISWLELPVLDLGQAVAFYSQLLRWRFASVPGQDNYAFTEDGGFQRGIGLTVVKDASQLHGATHYVTVEDVGETARKVEEAGGTVVRGPVAIEGEGRFLIFRTAEGNRLGAFQAS